MLHVRAQVLIHEKIYFLDRFGHVKLLRWGTSALCVDLLYSALMTRYYAGSDKGLQKHKKSYRVENIFKACFRRPTDRRGNNILGIEAESSNFTI